LVKKAFGILLISTCFFWSCATVRPPSPIVAIGPLPPDVISELSLNERIMTEEAWKNLREGRSAKALKILGRLNPSNPLSSAGFGYAYYLLSDLPAAEKYFLASLESRSDLALSHFGLAQIYEETGREGEAFAEYRNVLKQDPEHPTAKIRYEFIKTKKTGEALENGRKYERVENMEDAKAAYLQALYYSPRSNPAHLALADLYMKSDQPEQSLIHLKAASENAPEDVDIQKRYAAALFDMEKDKTSYEIYEKLNEKEPRNPEIKEKLQLLRNRLGIFELPSQYGAIANTDSITKEDLAALLGVKFQDHLEEPQGKPAIIIDIATSWASRFILKMTSLNLMDVYPNHTFQPEKPLTRAEMAEILVRLIKRLNRQGAKIIPQIPTDQIQIVDISPDNYYHDPVVQIMSYDIMTLARDNSFKPDIPVSGQQAIRCLDIILALIR